MIDEGTEEKTIFRLSLRPDQEIFERYTDQLATTLASDVFSANLSMDCLVTVIIQLYVSLNNELFDQPSIRELAETGDPNLLCSSRANFPIGTDFISGTAGTLI